MDATLLGTSCERQARFKRHASAVLNSIDGIKFDFSTAVLVVMLLPAKLNS